MKDEYETETVYVKDSRYLLIMNTIFIICTYNRYNMYIEWFWSIYQFASNTHYFDEFSFCAYFELGWNNLEQGLEIGITRQGQCG